MIDKLRRILALKLVKDQNTFLNQTGYWRLCERLREIDTQVDLLRFEVEELQDKIKHLL